MAAVRGAVVPGVFSALRSEENSDVLPALVRARHADSQGQLPVVEHLLDHSG